MAQLFLRKTSFNFEIWVTFDQGQRMALTFDIHSTSLIHFTARNNSTETPSAKLLFLETPILNCL